MITGSTGFIGSSLVATLLHQNYKLLLLTRGRQPLATHDNLQYISSNLDAKQISEEMDSVDGVIHLATCFLSQHTSEDLPRLIDSNLLLGLKIAEAAKIAKVKWFINVGTFWQNCHSQTYKPANLYAATKEAFESILEYYKSSFTVVNLRLNDTYGPNDTRPKIFNLWKNLIAENSSLDMSPGEQIVDFTHIDDIVNAFSTMVGLLAENSEKYQSKTYGICSMNRLKLKEVASIFEEVSKSKLKINWGKKPYRENEIMVPWTPEELVPNWKSTITLKTGIQSIL
ncbi:MAG: NAD-dependent epimerase/dehydratase family protein [Candidatus Cloacimonetes bacterium]|nr:NAD-dependent epimerase/dehydratase family protein [Candidatus Cloacimonadota bacterium]